MKLVAFPRKTYYHSATQQMWSEWMMEKKYSSYKVHFQKLSTLNHDERDGREELEKKCISRFKNAKHYSKNPRWKNHTT